MAKTAMTAQATTMILRPLGNLTPSKENGLHKGMLYENITHHSSNGLENISPKIALL